MSISVNKQLIIDVGACEGNDTDFYLRKGFRVIALEANPRTETELRQRFAAELAAGRLTVLNRAAYEVSGQEIPVWDTTVPGHSTVDWNPHRAEKSFAVKTIDWSELTSVDGVPYYCKIDIEGAEESLLRSFLGHAGRPTYISVEVHTVHPIAMLFTLGYRRFKLINQTTLHTAPVPEPALEGQHVPDTNHMHGSGLFGRELPGQRWFDFQETMNLYDAIHRLRAVPEILRSWYDCHAWMPD